MSPLAATVTARPDDCRADTVDRSLRAGKARWTTLLAAAAVVLPASVGTSLAVADGRWGASAVLSLVHLSAALLAWVVVRRLPSTRAGCSARGVVAVALLLAADAFVLRATATGVSPEVLLLLLVRAVMLALMLSAAAGERAAGGFADRFRSGWLACVLAPFLLLAAASLCDGAARVAVVFAGVAGGSLCLLCRYRAGRADVAASPGRGPRQPASLAAVFGLVLVAAAALSVAVGSDDDARWLDGGLLPTSGGTGRGADYARSGLGDGPDMALGSDDPQSTGFDLGDIFVTSEDPTLYDAFAETFGEPRPPRDGHKLLALDSSRLKTSAERLQQDLRNGRTLHLRRQKPGQPKPESPRPADALMLVRSPHHVHLRLAVYDDYLDGHWFPGLVPPGVAPLRVRAGERTASDAPAGDGARDGAVAPAEADSTAGPARASLVKRWLDCLDAPVSPALGGVVESQVRIGRLGGYTLPLGPNTVALRLGLVDDVTWFRGSAKWLIRLVHRPLPPGAVLDLHARPLDPRLRHRDPPMQFEYRPEDELDKAVAEWAQRVAAPHDDPWERVDAVVRAVREMAAASLPRRSRPAAASAGLPALHPNDLPTTLPARLPSCEANTAVMPQAGPDAGGAAEDPVLAMLAGRPPEHALDCATLAAVALRSLGYRVRLAAGVYADDALRDDESGLIPVHTSDVHVWVELATVHGAWAVLEATPGFHPPVPGFSLEGWLVSAGELLRAVGPTVLLVALMLVPTVLARRRIAAAVIYLVACGLLRCEVLLRNRPRHRVTWTVRLLELAHRAAGRPRPPQLTPSRFLASLGFQEFGPVADWALYAPADVGVPCPDAELRRRCLEALRAFPAPVRAGREG